MTRTEGEKIISVLRETAISITARIALMPPAMKEVDPIGLARWEGKMEGFEEAAQLLEEGFDITDEVRA